MPEISRSRLTVADEQNQSSMSRAREGAEVKPSFHTDSIGGGLDQVRTTLFQGCHFAFTVQGVGEPVVFKQGVGFARRRLAAAD